MKRFILFIFVILSIRGDAQDYFFNFVLGWENNFSTELEDGYLLIGIDADFPLQNKLAINKINHEGSALDTTIFTFENVYSTHNRSSAYSGVRMDEDNILFIANSYTSSPTTFEAALVNYHIPTDSFSVLNETDVNDENRSQHWCLTVPNDSTIYTATRIKNVGYFEKIMLYNYDILGNIRWQYYFSDGCIYCYGKTRQVLPLSNGNIAMVIDRERSMEPYGGFYDRNEIIIVIVDGVTGEELNIIYPGDQATYAVYSGGILEMENGDLLTSYVNPIFYDSTGERQYNDNSAIFLERYTIDGTLVSSQNYYEILPHSTPYSDHGIRYWVRQMQWLADGNILLSGSSHFGGFLMKMDPNGELIWNRDHFPNEFDDYESFLVWYTVFDHVLPTSDGGYLCTGTFVCSPGGTLYPQGKQTAIAVKVDQYGCLEEGCQVGIGENSTESDAFLVYPNPSSGVFNVKLPENEKVDLIVYDMLGATVFQATRLSTPQYTLDLSSVEDGVYTIQLLTQSGKRYFTKIIKQ